MLDSEYMEMLRWHDPEQYTLTLLVLDATAHTHALESANYIVAAGTAVHWETGVVGPVVAFE